jgi:RNA polymerase sigma-70 factor (ECF subfamily)
VITKIAVKSVARKMMIRFLLMELEKISARKFGVKDFIEPTFRHYKNNTGERHSFPFSLLNRQLIFAQRVSFTLSRHYGIKLKYYLKQDIQSAEQLLMEEEVIKRAKSDPNAFRELYERYFKRIFLFVLHRIGDKEESADITSQVFLKALQSIAVYQFRGLPFSSWLFRIAVNECNNFFRKNKRDRLVILEDEHVENLYDQIFGESAREELQRKLPYVLEKLNADELQIIELRFLEGRPFKEVADILSISETYAKVRTYRILDKMKKLFVGNEK